MGLKRFLYLALGWLSVGLAIIGVILPLLPTAPFLILAVWAFSRSSPALAEKIRSNKTFGPLVQKWQDHGIIPVKAKIAAVVMMSVTGSYLLLFSPAPLWASIAACTTMVLAAVYVLSRPSYPPVA
jgi:uncharacterized protein